MSFIPRCNLCFTSHIDNDGVFTSCGHFFCNSCFHEKGCSHNKICPICNQDFSVLLLKDTLPDDINKFIHEDIGSTISQIQDIYSFQEGHQQAYINYLTEKLEKKNREIDSIKQKYEKIIEELKEQLSQKVSGSSFQQTPRFSFTNNLSKPDFSKFKSFSKVSQQDRYPNNINISTNNPSHASTNQVPQESRQYLY
ncbi:hypothetical protein WA158_006082 [Blastocystis sp. Blastoise]